MSDVLVVRPFYFSHEHKKKRERKKQKNDKDMSMCMFYIQHKQKHVFRSPTLIEHK